VRSRQIVASVGTLAALAVGYALYSATLGLLTDFPQLEETLKTPLPPGDLANVEKSAVRESEVAAVRGFGPGCRELTAPLILESRRREDRGVAPGRGVGVYVYAETYELPESNPNQLRLKPFSLVNIIRSKDEAPEHDEIVSLRGREAVLEFDRPIDATRLTGVNPVAGWVEGDVVLKTNRKTSEPTDDIVLFTDRMHYDRTKNLIWADGAVKIVVENEGKASGVGLEVELDAGPPEGEEKRRLAARLARLLRDVRFEWTVQDRNTLLGAPAVAGPTSGGGARNSDVVISSRGPFEFDLQRDEASFEQSVRIYQRTPPSEPDAEPKVDQIEADRLTVRFQRDEAPAKPDGEPNVRIRQAAATGEQVVLLSESRSLHATGNSLEYDADQRRATLRGREEMIAVLNNAVLHARSLIVDHDQSGEVRQLIADGPSGWMELGGGETEAEGGGRKPQLVARWQQRLRMTQSADSPRQIVRMTGGVELEHERGAMTCDELTVHLVPLEGREGAGQPRFEPVKLEAEGNVSAESEQWAVNSETLLMDILHRSGKEPQPQGAAGGDDRPELVSKTPSTAAAPSGPEAKPPAERRDPLMIAALRVSIVLEQLGARSRPVSAWAEGDVRLTQTPSTPNAAPVEIRGEQMEYKSERDGDVVVVSGSPKRQASVKRADAMHLEARHQIRYHEGNNRVDVGGPGFLRLESDNSLTGRGGRARRPIQIDWSSAMNFDGKIGYFEGDARARQADAEVRCQILQVTFDRRLDMRADRSAGGERAAQRLAVEYVNCDRDVVVVDRQVKANGVVQQMQIQAPELRFDNVEGSVVVGGPGRVTVVEPNGVRDARPGPAPPFVVSAVDFQDRMIGNQSSGVVKFYGGVRIVHTPVQDPSAPIDEDALPDAGMVVHATRAEMSEEVTSKGAKNRLFNAFDNVKVQSRGYWATCGRLAYNQESDVLILAAEQDRSAIFYRQLRPGQPPESFPARQIRFDRKTGEIRTEGSEGFQQFDFGSPDRSPQRR
jgi:lipopolysaccharide export system protein LptA